PSRGCGTGTKPPCSRAAPTTRARCSRRGPTSASSGARRALRTTIPFSPGGLPMTGPSTTRCSLLALAMIVASGLDGSAQGPTYNLGRPATRLQLAMPDLAVGPDGKDLPPGSGTAREGATVYAARGCARCHGSKGAGGPGPVLIAPPGRSGGIVSYPFAPLILSYINQMMPLDMQQQVTPVKKMAAVGSYDSQTTPCCLSPDEVYSLTAFLLFRGGIIAEDQAMSAETLPQVKMPNRDAYAPPPYLNSPWKPGMRQAENK